MSEKKKEPKKLPPARLIGVELFLIVFILLIMLQYSVILSFILAVISGFTGGRFWHWWHSKDENTYESQQQINIFTLFRRKKIGIEEAQTRRRLREQNNPKGSVGIIGFIFGRHK